MFAYGAIMLVLLYSPQKEWALEHSIAEVVSTTDRRVDNRVDTADEPMAIAGSAVVMFAGAWIGILVPYVMNRSLRKQRSAAGYDPDAPYDAAYDDPST
jgi:hypothetical protein